MINPVDRTATVLSIILLKLITMLSNVLATLTWCNVSCRFGKDVKIVHFLGPMKPWHHTYNHETGNVYIPPSCQGGVPHERSFLQLWWDIYLSIIQTDMQVRDCL